MQDSAPPYCTNVVLEFLIEKFRGRVISRRTENSWPAHSPDFNSLDFNFWAEVQMVRQNPLETRVYMKNTVSIESHTMFEITFARIF